MTDAADPLPQWPPTVSQRGSLRAGLPPVYREGAVGDALLTAFEKVIDPIVALLDNLHAHLDVWIAPEPVVDLVTEWLGVAPDRGLSLDARRHLASHATHVARDRGTRHGISHALHHLFEDVDVEVEDSGRVTSSLDPDEPPPAPAPPPAFTVRCTRALDDEEHDALVRAIEALRPAHVPYRLEVPGR